MGKFVTVMLIMQFATVVFTKLSSRDIRFLYLANLKECLTDLSKYNFRLKKSQKCRINFDQFFTCWPEIARNTTVKLPCPNLFYIDTDFIERKCLPDGRWDRIKLQKWCKHLPPAVQDINRDALLIRYNISTVKELLRAKQKIIHEKRLHKISLYLTYTDCIFCFLGLIILFIFIPLRHPRIMLHRNLLFAFCLDDLFHIIELETSYFGRSTETCSGVYLFRQYLFLAEVTWMFNEGYFQFRQFYFVFVRHTYILPYILFGWLFPGVIFAVYTIFMFSHPPLDVHLHCWIYTYKHKYTYIIYIPAYILLFINIMIVIYLMYIIWSKLQHDNLSDVQKARKAARGFLLLVFLLGGGHTFTLYGPDQCMDFRYFKIIISNIQGIIICVTHVIFSREVGDATKLKLRGLFGNRNNASKLSRSTSKDNYSRRISSLDRRVSNLSQGTNKSQNRIVPEEIAESSKPPSKINDELILAVDRAFQTYNLDNIQKRKQHKEISHSLDDQLSAKNVQVPSSDEIEINDPPSIKTTLFRKTIYDSDTDDEIKEISI